MDFFIIIIKKSINNFIKHIDYQSTSILRDLFGFQNKALLTEK